MERTLRIRSLTPGLLILAVLVVFAGCTKSEAPTPTPQAQAAFRVTGVELGNAVGADKRVAAPSVTFKPNDTIYASVLTEGAAPSISLTARWTYGDGQVVSESTQTIAPTGPAVTEFHITKPDGWPAGKYQVEVSVNGQKTETRSFAVSD